MLITAHGSVSGQRRIINHYPHCVIHPCPIELTVDILLQNLILKLFTSAPTSHDLFSLRQMLEVKRSLPRLLSCRIEHLQTLESHRCCCCSIESRQLIWSFRLFFSPNNTMTSISNIVCSTGHLATSRYLSWSKSTDVRFLNRLQTRLEILRLSRAITPYS